jgi:membrane associated rhomboid family serine protease
MSLKALHIVFVLASSLLMVMFGVWAGWEYFGPRGSPIHLVYLVTAVAGLAALLVYGKYFLKKLRHISYL